MLLILCDARNLLFYLQSLECQKIFFCNGSNVDDSFFKGLFFDSFEGSILYSAYSNYFFHARLM